MPKEDKDKKELVIKNVIPVNIVDEMKESYLDYSMSVIVSRALPDVRDGLKPVHRRILFSMHELGLTFGGKFRKSATVVGDVLGKYHPHGDSACYDALARMAQDFSMRYPLVAGQGNFGSIDGDSPAAMRYTEAKMAKLSSELLRDIEKQTVDYRPNYDGSRKEPIVLPSTVPNLLLNGTLGIAVGMATKIPPHNLNEVMGALIHLADNEEATNEDLLEFVKGPDFPTGGVIFNQKDIRHAYSTGRGGILLRGEAEIVESKVGSFQIIISSIPYQVNKAELIIKIADLVRDKKLEGIRDIRDESTRDVRIVIDLKTGGQPQKILNSLYKHTELETTFHLNTLALVDGIPKLLNLKGLLEEFLKHRQEIIVRRTRYDLKQAEDREHILLGLKKALDHIDEIIKTIKKSSDTKDAHGKLMKQFKFSDRQSTAILEMKLQKLAGLERKKIEDELKEKQRLIKEYKAILADPKKVVKIMKDEFVEIKDKYGDDRKTKVIKSAIKEINPEDLIPEKEDVLVITSGGYIKRTDPKEYRSQKRGGKGVIDLNVKEEDFVSIFLTASTHDDLLFFSDRGKVYQTKMYDIPDSRRASRGKSIMNFLPLEAEEGITSVCPRSKEDKNEESFIVMITKNGVAKKVESKNFKDVRRSGLLAIKLATDDSLFSVLRVKEGDNIILATKEGQSICFNQKDLRPMGRPAAGVRALKLKKGDEVVGASSFSPSTDGRFLVLSEKGFGKMTELSEYRAQKRGGSGVKTAKVTPKTGKLVIARIITDEEEIIAISRQGQVIRTKISELPVLGRQTQGVRIMRMKEGDAVATFTCL